MVGEIVGHRHIDDDLEKYLTEEERHQLLADLHRVLVWVGEKVPDRLVIDRKMLQEEIARLGLSPEELPPEVHLEEGSIYLHELIWKLLNAQELTETEQKEVLELINILERSEKADEDLLSRSRLSHHQANVIYKEAAGFIRAMLDLKDILKGKSHGEERQKAIRAKVEDVRRWKSFMEEVKSGEASDIS